MIRYVMMLSSLLMKLLFISYIHLLPIVNGQGPAFLVPASASNTIPRFDPNSNMDNFAISEDTPVGQFHFFVDTMIFSN